MSENVTKYLLPPRIDLVALKGLKTDLLARRGGDVCLDAGAVEHVSGLGFQLLISAVRTWAADNRRLQISNPSGAFSSASRQLGIDFERTLT